MDDGGRQSDSTREGASHPNGDAQCTSPAVLREDYVYEALTHPERRYLCSLLFTDASWSVSTLATKLAAWNHAIPEPEVTSEQHKRMVIALYHVHLPKLADKDVIKFDTSAKTIRPAANASDVLQALEGIETFLDAPQQRDER